MIAPAASRGLSAALFLLAGLAASARAECVVRKPQFIGDAQAYSDTLADGSCFTDVGPAYAPTMIYRSYSFFDTGLLMVFISFGTGTNSATTGSREFYFFPRTRQVELRADAAAETLSVVMANGDELAFDPKTGQVRSSARGEVTVSPRVDAAERGGVEFAHYEGLLLDSGFARGHSPQDSRDGQSVFRNAYGQLCRVTNREVFAYAGGEHSFKFTDAELSAWLKKRCPALRVDF